MEKLIITVMICGARVTGRAESRKPHTEEIAMSALAWRC